MDQDQPLSREIMDFVSIVKRITRQEFSTGENTPTFTQYRLLKRIQDGIRHVGKLAEAFGISQPATSIIVNSLVKDGYLKRVPHPTDRRQIELHLTAKATRALESGYKRVFEKVDRRLADLPKTKQAAITKMLRELSQALSQELDHD